MDLLMPVAWGFGFFPAFFWTLVRAIGDLGRQRTPAEALRARYLRGDITLCEYNAAHSAVASPPA